MQKKGTPEERRECLRLDYSRLISFTHHDPDNQVAIPGRMAAIKDISEAGVLLETAEIFESGNQLDLDIAFEQEKIVRVQGEVVHVRKSAGGLYDVGVRFKKVKKSDRVYIKNFIEASEQTQGC